MGVLSRLLASVRLWRDLRWKEGEGRSITVLEADLGAVNLLARSCTVILPLAALLQKLLAHAPNPSRGSIEEVNLHPQKRQLEEFQLQWHVSRGTIMFQG